MDSIKRARQDILETGRKMLERGLVTATWGNMLIRRGTNCDNPQRYGIR